MESDCHNRIQDRQGRTIKAHLASLYVGDRRAWIIQSGTMAGGSDMAMRGVGKRKSCCSAWTGRIGENGGCNREPLAADQNRRERRCTIRPSRYRYRQQHKHDEFEQRRRRLSPIPPRR